MYFGVLEIESVENDVVTLKNGDKIEITDKNKELFTEEPLDGSSLQEKMVKIVAEEFKQVIFSEDTQEEKTRKLVDILFGNNLRLVDISQVWEVVFSDMMSVKTALDFTIELKNNETLVNALGKDKLDTFSRIFGAKDNAPSNSIRQVRMKDIFIN